MRNSILILLFLFALSACKKDNPAPETPTGSTIPTEFAAIAGLFDGNGIGAAVNLTEDIAIFFNVDGDKYAWLEDDEIKVVNDLIDPDGHFGDLPLASVGAATVLNGTALYLFDLEGMTYTAITFDADDADEGWVNDHLFPFSGTTFPLTMWGPDNCPYTSIAAMWNGSDPGTSCFGASEDVITTWMVSGPGADVVRYNAPGGGLFLDEDELENWTATNNCNGPDGLIPFESIGAACRLVRPNMIQELFFSLDGMQFSYYNVSEGEFSEVYDLY